ncbi:MAG: type I-E CRISPR-associated endoribonuclease Cas2e [Lachnospiraceae bacterium]|nr:type I-E CRISPR-associated endoribonuclease Cas2e [Lachnospiraceae bacterium]
MMVLHLTNCPPALRGDLTKWLMEIATGVYVGRVSARVRDKLWERVVETCKSGRAVLVFSTNNEQRMDFRVHGETWEPIDFDGLKLMLRPSPARLAVNKVSRTSDRKMGFSSASKFQKAKKYSKSYGKAKKSISKCTVGVEKSKTQNMDVYVVVDIETTGLRPVCDDIIEVGAIKVKDGKIVEIFQTYVSVEMALPTTIVALTGITDARLAEQGKALNVVLEELLIFLEDLPIVMHNASFDSSFLNVALNKHGHGRLDNHIEDTLKLAKNANRTFKNYKLKNLVVELKLDFEQMHLKGYKLHNSLGDCYLTYLLFQKLMDFDK